MPLSDLQKAKMKRMFDVYDFDRNGFIERKDYLDVIQNLASLRQFAPGSPEYAALQSAYLAVWEGLRTHADTNRDNRVSFEEMLAYNEAVMANAEEFEQQVLALGHMLFDILDVDGDGRISEGDYLQFARCLRFQAGKESFAKLAPGGHLSKEEVTDRIREFYFSQDDKDAGNWLFGEITADIAR